jgi:aarF domain-containing kinase
MLPDIYIDKLRDLEDKVPALLVGKQVQQFVCQSLKLDSIDQVFKEFDDTPIGSASIGQVHKATLLNGDVVAVKVQSPGAEKLFLGDVKTAKGFCQTFAPEQVAILDEIEKQFLTEFDYKMEAEHLYRVALNMRKFRDVVVPLPYFHLCTKEVLTMQFLNGPKLVDGIRDNATEYAKTVGKTFKELVKERAEEFDQFGFPPANDYPSSWKLECYRKILKIHDSAINCPRYFINKILALAFWVSNFSMFNLKLTYIKSFIPLNSSFIMVSCFNL